MTYPVGGAPDGAWQLGTVNTPQGYNESGVKSMIRAQNLSPWENAQGNLHSEFLSATLVNGEIIRLDNRIDELVFGSERAFLYTYSESDVWEKHPAAYKIVVDAFSGSTSGRNGVSSTRGGAGGYSGGWERATFTGTELEDLPNAVAVTIGPGTTGGSPEQAGSTSFGTFLTVSGATTDNYGSGSRTYKIRGGDGGNETLNGSAGGNGPFNPGGSGGLRTSGNGGNGGHGFSVGVGQIGVGSAGGGGAGGTSIFGRGGNGGHGGWPSAPGGGGGGGYGGVGTGGNGAAGAVFVTVYVADELGVAPSTPTNLAIANLTATSAKVTWTTSIDDVMVKHYVLFLDGTRYGVVNTTSNDFVGLTPATTYTVRVQAVDLGDNASELSEPLQFTTLV